MAQGKDERLGLRADLRMEEKALSASTESPPRANSAMMEFHEKTSDLSTYLLNRVVMFELVEKWRLCDTKRKFKFPPFIHYFPRIPSFVIC